MMPDIETGKNRANRATRELHDPRDMGGRVYGNLRPVFRPAGHGTLRKGRLHRGGYPPDRAHHGDERREIIRAYIKHGACAGLIEEIWVGMPIFHSVIQPESRSSNRRSDLPIVDQLDAGLKTTAKKGIWGIANTYLFRLRSF